MFWLRPDAFKTLKQVRGWVWRATRHAWRPYTGERSGDLRPLMRSTQAALVWLGHASDVLDGMEVTHVETHKKASLTRFCQVGVDRRGSVQLSMGLLIQNILFCLSGVPWRPALEQG